jgi:tRNA pseudouridine55 synthase
VTREAPVPGIDAELLAAAARRFTGSIEQTPPAFSAIKRDGVRSYRLARRGIEAPPHPPRTVRINQLELAVADGRSLRFRVSCGPGMYVRALARDLGLALGTVAHLAELRRERNGSFTLDAAAPLERVLQVLEGGAPAPLIPLREALSALPEVEVDQGVAARLRHGDARALDGIAVPAARFKVVAGGRLIAVAGAVSRLTSHLERIFLDG